MELYRWADACSPVSHCALWRNALLEPNAGAMAIWFMFKFLKLKIEFIYFSGVSEKEEYLSYAGGCKRSEENPWN